MDVISQAIIRSINCSSFYDYVMHGCEVKGNGRPSLDDLLDEPRQVKCQRLNQHCCPVCGCRDVVLLRLGDETVWKCATGGCVVPARQFVPVSADELGELS